MFKVSACDCKEMCLNPSNVCLNPRNFVLITAIPFSLQCSDKLGFACSLKHEGG